MKHIILSAAVSLAALLVLTGCCCKKKQQDQAIAVPPIFVPVFVCPCCGAMTQQPAWQVQTPCPVPKHKERLPKAKSKCAVCPVMAPREKTGSCKEKCGKAKVPPGCPMMKKPCPAATPGKAADGSGLWIEGVLVEETVEAVPGAASAPAPAKTPAAPAPGTK